MYAITINNKETMNFKNWEIYVGGFEVRKGMEDVLKYQSQNQTKKEKKINNIEIKEKFSNIAKTIHIKTTS